MQAAEPQALATATSANSATRQPRQVIRFTGLSDVIATAKALYEAQCLPRGVDRYEKLVPMLLAGAELGLGIMQTLKSITPPVNGQCNLYGDMGLALVRASGLLVKLDERITGEGDDREALCVIQRTGYAEKTFKYPLKLAKTLKSYQAAYTVDSKTKQAKGGPWYDDPENMLMWRARWRALRTEFGDVLNGMGGAEEQETEQAITVEVVSVSATPALPPAPLTQVPDEVIKELVRIKGIFDSTYTTETGRGQWANYLEVRGVAKARELSEAQAREMCEHFGRMVDPFGYPDTSTPPPSGQTASAI